MTERPAARLSAFEWDRMPAMADLWVESWQEAMPEIDFEARRGWLCHQIGTLIDEGAVIDLAVTDHEKPELLGFISVDPRTGYVDQLVVHPDHWGEGVARQLVQAASAHTRKGLSLDVNEENERAVRFYERAGFVVVGHGFNATSGRPTLRMERPPG